MARICVAVVTVFALITKPLMAETIDNLGRIYTSVTLASEQRFNGVSNSDGKPVLQGSIHWLLPDNYYAGIWATGVDYNDPGNTSREIDTYAGKKWLLGDTEFKAEVMYTSFNDNVPGPTYDFVQLKFDAARTFGAFSTRLQCAWSPEGAYAAGSTLHLRVLASYNIRDWLKLRGMIGRGIVEKRVNRTYSDFGITAKFRRYSFDLSHIGTNSARRDCGYTDWCESAFVGKITINGPDFRAAFWR